MGKYKTVFTLEAIIQLITNTNRPQYKVCFSTRLRFSVSGHFPICLHNTTIIINSSSLSFVIVVLLMFPLCPRLLVLPVMSFNWPQKSSSSHISRYTSKASRLQFPSGVKTYLWKVPSTHMAAGGERR